MRKVLYIATSDIHLNTFHIPCLRLLQSRGYDVDTAADNRGNIRLPFVRRQFDVSFPRKLLSRDLIAAGRRLKTLVRNENYDLIHCHTPIPSFLTRFVIANRDRNKQKLFYTAHGFHFYPGSGLKTWLTYFPAEYILSRWTDAIICINRTDFYYSKRYFKSNETFLIPGVGVSPERFKPLDKACRDRVRKSLDLKETDFVIAYVAEFIPRKNHAFLLECMKGLKKAIPNIKLLLAGKGVLMDKMKALARELDINDQVCFLGFRDDVDKLVAIADLGVSTSRHEGLGLGVVEHMMCGIPVVASLDKGHLELVEHGINGFLYKQHDIYDFNRRIHQLFLDQELRRSMGNSARQKAFAYTTEKSLEAMSGIYDFARFDLPPS